MPRRNVQVDELIAAMKHAGAALRDADIPFALGGGLACWARGGPATDLSVAAAAEFGADLVGHRSRPVNPQLLAAADDVIAMTRAHAHMLATHYPGVGPAARLLCGAADLEEAFVRAADSGVPA